ADDENQPGGGSLPDPPVNWHGARGSLPIGPSITLAEVLGHADSMMAVQAAKAEFARRGYVRHAELDSAAVNATCSAAILAYSRPGYSIQQVQAYILIACRRVKVVQTAIQCEYNPPFSCHSENDTLTVFETQVSGGLVAQLKVIRWPSLTLPRTRRYESSLQPHTTVSPQTRIQT